MGDRDGGETGKLPGWGGALVGRVEPGETALVPLILCPLTKSPLCPTAQFQSLVPFCKAGLFAIATTAYQVPGRIPENSYD